MLPTSFRNFKYKIHNLKIRLEQFTDQKKIPLAVIELCINGSTKISQTYHKYVVQFRDQLLQFIVMSKELN